MVNSINLYKYEGKEVRTVNLENGEIWWIGKDSCEALDIIKYRDVLKKLDSDERMSISVDTPGGFQEMIAINESGLYSLIFKSKKSEAKKFKRWITHEVIPSIRRTGSYKIPAIFNIKESKEKRLVDREKRLKLTLLKDAGVKFMKTLSKESLQQIVCEISEGVCGRPIMALPVLSGKLYTAGEIGKELKISAIAVGKIAMANGWREEPYTLTVLDKKKGCVGQTDALRYTELGRKNIVEYFCSRV